MSFSKKSSMKTKASWSVLNKSMKNITKLKKTKGCYVDPKNGQLIKYFSHSPLSSVMILDHAGSINEKYVLNLSILKSGIYKIKFSTKVQLKKYSDVLQRASLSL